VKKIEQVFHHYTKWEDFQNGMWRSVYGEERETFLVKAIEFTGDDKLYGEWMLRVVDRWPIACETNLTNAAINQRAWIGHAACCLGIDCPEDVVRQAWHCLTDQQRYLANRAADFAIEKWRDLYVETEQCQNDHSEFLFLMPQKSVYGGPSITLAEST